MERMGNPLLAPEERFIYKQYKTWPEGERWELIEGKAWSMSPAPTRGHQGISGLLFRRIGNFLEGKHCKAYDAPFDVLLPEADESDDEVATVVQPDILVFCDPSKLTEAGARGAPDWVIEILSPSTAKKDLNEKFELYQRRGVREYWVVDPDARAIHTWRLESPGRFGEESLYAKGEAVASAVLEGLVINSRELFAELE